MKACRVCGEAKPLDEFPRSRRNKDGRAGLCTLCNRAKVRAWQKANPERERARVRAWVNANADQVRERAAERRAANREHYNELSRQWQLANPQKRLETSRAYTARNLERERARKLAYFHALPPETRRARQRAWKAANPEKVRADNHARRANRYDDEGIEYIAILLNDPCSYCGTITVGTVTVDHIDALSRGGANEWQNITAACWSCNSSKHTKSLLEYLAA